MYIIEGPLPSGLMKWKVLSQSVFKSSYDISNVLHSGTGSVSAAGPQEIPLPSAHSHERQLPSVCKEDRNTIAPPDQRIFADSQPVSAHIRKSNVSDVGDVVRPTD